jgi:ArsR family transcriptional regulator, zinc-responsive transcriptional repressor
MGVTKSDLFSDKQNELARVAKIIGHPARVAILEYLIKADTCINGDLVQELGLAQATISQHLRELKETGIIKGSIEGVSVCYCIDAKRWQEIQTLFAGLFAGFPKSESKCC